MKTTITVIACILSWSISAQDTLRFTGTDGEYWIETSDSIIKPDSIIHCWRKDQYYNDILFSTEYLALDKSHPISEYVGYYPNGNVAFIRNYFFDGTSSELHGLKELYYQNGNLKEIGLYYHGIKHGNWFFYNPDGTTSRWTQYVSTEIGSITSFSQVSGNSNLITNDTITIESDPSFYDTFPCASFGKNGIEVIYDQSKILEGRVYNNGKLILTEKRKFHVKRLIRKRK